MESITSPLEKQIDNIKLEEARFNEVLLKASKRQRLLFYSFLLAGLTLIYFLIFPPSSNDLAKHQLNTFQKELAYLEYQNASLKNTIAKMATMSVEEKLQQDLDHASPHQLRIKNTLCIANLFLLACFCILLFKKHTLSFKEKIGDGRTNGETHYTSLIEVVKDKTFGNEEAIQANNTVNRITSRFSNFIIYYAISLIAVYVLFLLDKNVNNPLHSYYKMGQDIFNYLSAVFVYLAFKGIYNLRSKESRSSFHGTVFVTVLYIGTYIVLFDKAASNKTISTLLSLVAGMSNGLAMILLFSRFISIGFMVQKMKEMQYSRLFSIGLVYVLPVYAIFQPLFGNFYVQEFGSVDFTNFVFLVCFFGKAFFLYATYLLISKKMVHLFLHLVINEHYASQWFEECFVLPKK